MRQHTFLAFFLLLALNQLEAQYTEVGLTAGYCSYVGDLQNRIQSGTYKFGYGVMGTYNASTRVFYRAMASKGQFAGSDQYSNDYLTRLRNLSVVTDFYDISAQVGFNLTPFEVRADKMAAPYLYAGIGGMWFDPKAQLNNKWVSLQPLGTEGQLLENSTTSAYNRLALMFPVGGGFRFAMTERLNLGIDVGVRFALTDYLDDVSGLYPDVIKLSVQNSDAAALSFRTPELFVDQTLDNPVGKARGDAYAKDRYFYGGITLTYSLSGGYDMEFDTRYQIFKSKNKLQPPMPTELEKK